MVRTSYGLDRAIWLRILKQGLLPSSRRSTRGLTGAKATIHAHPTKRAVLTNRSRARHLTAEGRVGDPLPLLATVVTPILAVIAGVAWFWLRKVRRPAIPLGWSALPFQPILLLS